MNCGQFLHNLDLILGIIQQRMKPIKKCNRFNLSVILNKMCLQDLSVCADPQTCIQVNK